MSEKFSESVGRVVSVYTWLMVDALFLLLLLACVLGYKDFDDPMKLFLRAAFVAFWAHLWVSGVHMLAYLRHSATNSPMPAALSYSLFGLKMLVIVGLVWWARSKALL